MLSGQVSGDVELIAKIRNLPNSIRSHLKQAVAASAYSLHRHVLDNKLSGQLLRRKTGTLARSINVELSEQADGFSARVGDLKKAVVYASIHEYGGVTPPHVILPKKKKALAFGGGVYAKVNHPGSRILEKRYLRDSLAEQKQEFFARVRAAVSQGIK